MVNLYEEWEELKSLGNGRKVKHARDRVHINYSSNKSATTSNQFYNGLPNQAIFKVIKNTDKATGKTNRNTGYSLMKAMDYLARDTDEFTEDGLKKELEHQEKENENILNSLDETIPLYTSDGRTLSTKEDRYKLYKEWEETFTERKNGKDFEHVLLSTNEVPGTNDEKVLKTARDTLQKQFGNDGYDYIFNLHNDTEHTHVHAIIRVHNTITNKRLDIRQDRIWETRVAFANELNKNGFNYEALIKYERIKKLEDKLTYIKKNDLTWFQSNVEKIKNEDITAQVNNLKNLDKHIHDLNIQRKALSNKMKLQKSDTLKIQIKSLNTKINELYTTKRAIIYDLNTLEFQLQTATKKYEDLAAKKDKISWLQKGTKAYKKIEEKTQETHELVTRLKIDMDKVQTYLDDTRLPMNFSDKIKKDTLDYVNENINNTKDINKVLNQLNNLNKKLPKAKITQEINKLKNEYLQNNKLVEYQEQGKIYLIKELEYLTSEPKEHKKIIDKISNNYSVYDYELKAIGLNPHDYAFEKDEVKINTLHLDHVDKDLILKAIQKSNQKESFKNFLTKQIKNKNFIYEYQLNILKVNKAELLEKVNKSFTQKIITKDKINYAKTYIDKSNDGTLAINKEVDKYIKFETLKKEALSNQDLAALDQVYKNEKPLLLSQAVKEYGHVLNVDPKEINKELWNEFNGTVKDYDGFGEHNVKNIPDYQDKFIEKYIEQTQLEYTMEKLSQEVETQEQYNHLENDVKEFDQLINKFKDELQNEKEQEQYKRDYNLIISDLDEGKFLTAREQIDNFDFKNTEDKKNIESVYELAIDKFSNDENLDGIKNNIEKQNEIEFKSYEIAPSEMIYNDLNKELPQKNIKELDKSNSKELEFRQNIEPQNNVIAKKEAAINYDEISKESDGLTKDLLKKVTVILEKDIKERNYNDIKENTFKASKSLANELKRNLKQVENTKQLLNTFKNSDKDKAVVKELKSNLEHFTNRAKDLNSKIDEFTKELSHKDISELDKNITKLNLYNELNKHEYSKRIIEVLPKEKDNIVNKNIDHFKSINFVLSRTNDKEKQNELIDSSSKLLKNFNTLNPTWKQEKSITKLHAQQQKGLNKRQLSL